MKTQLTFYCYNLVQNMTFYLYKVLAYSFICYLLNCNRYVIYSNVDVINDNEGEKI